MNQHVIPCTIAVRQRFRQRGYHIRASLVGREATSTLRRPERLLATASRLLHPDVTLPLRDGLAFGRALGGALLTPPLRDLLLYGRAISREAEKQLQIRRQIAAPELAALPWEWLTIGSSRY